MKTKKVIGLVAAVVFVCTSIAAPFTSFAEGPTAYTAYKATEAPKIDGKLDEKLWSNDFVEYKDAETGVSFQFKYAWDKDNLYLAAKLTDSTLTFAKDKTFKDDAGADQNSTFYSWDYDNLQLYFSPTNTQDVMKDNDVQMIFTYQDDGKPAFRVGAAASNQKSNLDGGVYKDIKSGCSKTDKGWDIEIAMPWSNIGVTDPATATFGISLGQNDTDKSVLGTENSIYTHAGEYQWNSLAGSDTLKVSEETSSGKAAAPSETKSKSDTDKSDTSKSNSNTGMIVGIIAAVVVLGVVVVVVSKNAQSKKNVQK